MKSATGLTGSGSRDWVVQRVSAIILAIYSVVILGWFLVTPEVNYATWHGFMMALPMKIFSLLAILSLAGHAWVGMWTIFTDYVHSGLRLVLQSLMIIAVVIYTVWAIGIFWGL